MSRTFTRFDLFFMLALAVMLGLVQEFGWSGYLFKLPFVTLLVFYYLGKWARTAEIRRAERNPALPAR